MVVAIRVGRLQDMAAQKLIYPGPHFSLSQRVLNILADT
jgi:hypothetical protein